MRIGLIGLLHESNTFSSQATTLAQFRDDLLLEGLSIAARLGDSHHEIGGFFAGLQAAGSKPGEIEPVPIFVARALPAGTIETDDFQYLVERLLNRLGDAGPLDGLLLAPHGATVSHGQLDADGYWLEQVRAAVGDRPMVATLDAHANLSPRMVQQCNAIVAYRTNPHLDQRATGRRAAELLVATLRGSIRPTMSACFPPMLISIDRQCTDERPLSELASFADQLLETPGVLANNYLLGFPYSDVAEMGAATLAVADNDAPLADAMARRLAQRLWDERAGLQLDSLDISAALERCSRLDGSVCLLDMGDNVGGGSAADGALLLDALGRHGPTPAFVCLYEPQATAACQSAGVGAELTMDLGGKCDRLHGPPGASYLSSAVAAFGGFRESQPRHGGFVEFDQGLTAIVRTNSGVTVMLTSRRMVPFSLRQLISCGLEPSDFRVLVAKGVNAPLAAYREVCQHFLRVNTPGSTTADVTRLPFQRRRRPLFPLEPETQWSAEESLVVRGA